jgi:hypothetical protein
MHDVKVQKSIFLMGTFALMLMLKPCLLIASSPPDLLKSISSVPAQDSLPKLKSLLLNDAPFLSVASDSIGVLRLPPVPRGFFCKFEDKMQQKWKIPLNLELK